MKLTPRINNVEVPCAFHCSPGDFVDLVNGLSRKCAKTGEAGRNKNMAISLSWHHRACHNALTFTTPE
jgi:hypothetical protein